MQKIFERGGTGPPRPPPGSAPDAIIPVECVTNSPARVAKH